MEITRREIIASLVIVGVMLILGLFINSGIELWQNDQYAKYDRAARITEQDLFQHGMDTDLGNAFVYGDLTSVDPVAMEHLDGEYSKIKRVKEHYTMHTRTYTDSKGHTHTTIYYSWDWVGEDKVASKHYTFLGITLPAEKFEGIRTKYNCTYNISSVDRYVFYTHPVSVKATIFTVLSKDTISDKSKVFEGKDIAKTVEELESGTQSTIFLVAWAFLTVIAIAVFLYADNDWLNRDDHGRWTDGWWIR
jgi:hypothetical protein